jgi:hypothetical protein
MTVDIVTHLSSARLSTYTTRCAGDHARALDLYRANARISGTAHTAVHYFEVIFRNALDRQLRTWNHAHHGSEHWTHDPAPLLVAALGSDRVEGALRDARRATGERRAVTHDDVVAQLSFGVWRYLLPSARNIGKQRLWDEALQHAFPNRRGVRVDQIVRSVSIVYDFRNRIAHHEPIFGLDLRGKRKAMRDVLNSIGPTARKWFVEHESLSPALDEFYAAWPEFARTN